MLLQLTRMRFMSIMRPPDSPAYISLGFSRLYFTLVQGIIITIYNSVAFTFNLVCVAGQSKQNTNETKFWHVFNNMHFQAVLWLMTILQENWISGCHKKTIIEKGASEASAGANLHCFWLILVLEQQTRSESSLTNYIDIYCTLDTWIFCMQ